MFVHDDASGNLGQQEYQTVHAAVRLLLEKAGYNVPPSLVTENQKPYICEEDPTTTWKWRQTVGEERFTISVPLMFGHGRFGRVEIEWYGEPPERGVGFDEMRTRYTD